jgi:putative DNA primase/helicase
MNKSKDETLSEIVAKKNNRHKKRTDLVDNKYRIVNSFLEYPEHDSKKVLDTYKNLGWLLSRLNITIKHNLMTRKREISIPNQYVFIDDIENDTLARIEDIATLNGMPNKNIDKHLNVLAGESPYHPVRDCINSIQWDGEDRLTKFLETIKTENVEFDKILITTWMLAAVAAAFSEKGFSNHGVLVLQGNQGIGKTAWIKTLDPTMGRALKTGVILDPTNKDSVISANRFWIIELGELDGTLNKSDAAYLKSFLTSSEDDVRVPWGRRETFLARRTAYIATVNESSFLVDTTGNRRWWSISVTSINYEHNINMQQVWAQIYYKWRSGCITYLSDESQKIMNKINIKHEKIDPIHEKILSYFDWESTNRMPMRCTEVLEEIGYNKPTKSEVTRAGSILKKIIGQNPEQNKNGSFHYVPVNILVKKRFHEVK